MTMSQSTTANHRIANMGSTLKVIGAAALLLLGSGQLYAGGDAAAGKEKSATCAACHGTDGVSTIDTNPILAGQYPSYIMQALQDYRSGERQSPIMAGMAAGLSDQDIADLAAFFSEQKGPLQTISSN